MTIPRWRAVCGAFRNSVFLLTASVLIVSVSCAQNPRKPSQTSKAVHSPKSAAPRSAAPRSAAPRSTSKKSAPIKASSSGVSAIVVTEEALVYSRPDFDAKVIGQLKAGRPVKVSKGTTGEVAKFHKIRIGKTIGYIAEIDVRIEGASKRKVERTQGQDGSRRSRTEATPEASRQRFPIYFSRYFGLIGGMADFKESIPGVDARANLLFYGLKITGPDVIIEGPIIDFNLALHYGAPSYYEPLSTIKPTGFVMWADALLLIPFAQRDDWMIYLGAGPLVTLSKFNVISTGRPMNLMSLDAGVAVSIGGAFRVEKVALRLEGKYLFEKTSYTVFQASLQTEF